MYVNDIISQTEAGFCHVAIEEVWKPSFYTERLINIKAKTILEDEARFISCIKDAGILVYGVEADITFSCPMTFTSFPYDSHSCSLRMFDLSAQNPKKKMVMTTKRIGLESWSGAFSPTLQEYSYKVTDSLPLV